MQTENLKEVTKLEVRPYLRVAAIDKKTSFCYLYIGNNLDSARILRNSFKSGYSAPDLDEAQKMLKTAASVIDVIIIDVNCQKSDLKSFHFFLTSHLLDQIPVLFNDSQMKGNRLDHMDYIDDVIDLSNWQFDFYNKVSFLKKIKTSDSIAPAASQKVKSGHWTKRLFDIIFAATLLVLILPVLVLIALAIRLESKGPVFYTAKRAGRGFRIFNFYKFRTMVVNADKKIQDLAHLNQYAGENGGATFFKISNDPRITRVGKFLRNTSLDELPQLLNVLKGDMSLVGNRPLPLYEAATLTTNDFAERFMAPAGITGLWQIKKRGCEDMSAEERISLDISYARKSNLMYDLWIMANTPRALFQKTDV